MTISAQRIGGIVTALVTPLTPTGALDNEGFDRLIERQLAGGVDALFALGSVGEGPLVSEAVYDQVAARIVAFWRAGIELFMLQFQPCESEMARFAAEVRPRVERLIEASGSTP